MKLPIFIAFEGAGCSGKTTTINVVQERLTEMGYNVGRIDEVVRNTIKKFPVKDLNDIRKDVNLVYQFQSESLKTQIAMEHTAKISDYDFVLSDRSAYDFMVYTMMFLPFDKTMDFVMEHKNMINNINYEHLVFCEPLAFVDDGFRVENCRHTEIEMFENAMKPKATLVLPVDSVENRVDMVMSVILGSTCQVNVESECVATS